MATRGLEGSGLPSSVTSHPNDNNKPAERGAEPGLLNNQLDFEGNLRPGYTRNRGVCGAGVTGEGVGARDNRREGICRRGKGVRKERLSPDGGTRRYNHFNYWRRDLPDVSREIQQYIHRSPPAGDVNGNHQTNTTTTAFEPPEDYNHNLSDTHLHPNQQYLHLSDSTGFEPSKDHHDHLHPDLYPATLVLFDPGTGEWSPNGDNEPLDHHQREKDEERRRLLAQSRLKSGSFCDYSRLVSARPFSLGESSSPYGSSLHVDQDPAHARRNSAPVDILKEFLGGAFNKHGGSSKHRVQPLWGGEGGPQEYSWLGSEVKRGPREAWVDSEDKRNESSPYRSEEQGDKESRYIYQHQDVYRRHQNAGESTDKRRYLCTENGGYDYQGYSFSDGDYSRSSLSPPSPSSAPQSYSHSDDEVFAGGIMGNIQGAEGRRGGKGDKKGKDKGKGKMGRGKSPSKAKLHGSRDVLQEGGDTAATTPSLATPMASIPAPIPQVSEPPKSIVTESWKEARKTKFSGTGEAAIGTDSAVAFVDSSSSSESIFTEARSGGGGGPNSTSMYDVITPVDGATTPLFSEALDLPIDAIMSGEYSASITPTASNPPNIIDSLKTTTSLTDDLLRKTLRLEEGGTDLSTLKKTERRDGSQKTLQGSIGSEGSTPQASPSLPHRRPHSPPSPIPPPPPQVHTTTEDTRVEARQQRQQRFSPATQQHDEGGNTSEPDRRSGGRDSGSVSESDHAVVSDSSRGDDGVTRDSAGRVRDSGDSSCVGGVVVSPEGVELELSVFEEGGDILHHPRILGGEDSLGSFICVDLERPTRPLKTQSLGDDHHLPHQYDEYGTDQWAAEDKPRSFSADDLDYDDDDEYAYDDEDMPQASAAASSAGRNGGSSAFRVSRHRKVELQPAKPSARTINNNNTNSAKNRALSENCIAGSGGEERRGSRSSNGGDLGVDSNVLRKVASLTLDRATIDKKVTKPKFVPEKLDFKIYEKFEGQMLINWFVSAFSDGHYLRYVVTTQDLKILATQFCTHLLAAGVIRQIEDVSAPMELLFRPDLMYFWSHTEASPAQILTPGKISPSAWPPPNFAELISSARPGAKYTEAEPSNGEGTAETCYPPAEASEGEGEGEVVVEQTEVQVQEEVEGEGNLCVVHDQPSPPCCCWQLFNASPCGDDDDSPPLHQRCFCCCCYCSVGLQYCVTCLRSVEV